MRERHVPSGLAFIETDVDDALDAVPAAISIACDALGIKRRRLQAIQSLLRADLEMCVRPAVKESRSPGIATLRGLIDAANIGHSAIYNALKTGLKQDVERCAVAIPLLLRARGDFVGRTVWCGAELKSPVGKEASGAGITGGRQQLYGLGLTGGDLWLPVCLRAPDEDGMDEKRLTEELARMVKIISETLTLLGRYARTRDSGLAAFDVNASELARQTLDDALLVPALGVGTSVNDEWSSLLRPNAAALSEEIQPSGIQQLVVESTADPQTEPKAWKRLSHDSVTRLLSFAGQMGLDTAVRASEVTYLARNDGYALHRHQHSVTGPSRALTSMAQSMSYDIVGFDDNENPGRAFGEAIGCVEFLTTSTCLSDAARHFGERLAPAAIKASDARGVLCPMRMIEFSLLASVARRRQEAELYV